MNVENENGRVFPRERQGCILDLEHIDETRAASFLFSPPRISPGRNFASEGIVQIIVDFFCSYLR